MKNHTDVLIFHTAICVGASQIALDGRCESDIRIAPSRKRSGMEIFMEQSYAEANAKKKTTPATVALKIVLILIVITIFMASFLSKFIMLLGVAAAVALIWYWPRFNVEWEYVYCDGQLDFDMIQGGEKRKNILRIEIEEADAVAPLESSRMDGYRHLPVKDFTSLRSEAKVYAIATRANEKEEKMVITFEPSEKMLEMMYTKCPNIVEK
ncbi:MAG: hypothetical protein J1E62_12200 [Lachnospiraceae bacterium]|nr:hypothetical protein [Lachnospiraceae bacterium]